MHLPPLHFSEVKSNLSVGHSFFVKITAITPDESGHIIAWNERNETMTMLKGDPSESVSYNPHKHWQKGH